MKKLFIIKTFVFVSFIFVVQSVYEKACPEASGDKSLIYLDTDGSSCVGHCSPYFYKDASNTAQTDQLTCKNECTDFILPTTECATSCTDTYPYYYLQGNKFCVQACPESYPFLYGTGSNQCIVACPQYYYTNAEGKDVCISTCNEDYPYLDGTKCITKSDYSGSRKCNPDSANKFLYAVTQVCVETCSTASGNTYTKYNDYEDSGSDLICVSECKGSLNHMTDNLICTANCDNEHKYYTLVGSIYSCETSCSNYIDGSECVSSCSDYSDGSTCVDSCGEKYYDDKKCVASCTDNIYKIKETKKVCTACTDGSEFLDDKTDSSKKLCVSSCPDSHKFYYKNANNVKECIESCPRDHPYWHNHYECQTKTEAKAISNTVCDGVDPYYSINDEFKGECLLSCHKTVNGIEIKNFYYLYDSDQKICVDKCQDSEYIISDSGEYKCSATTSGFTTVFEYKPKKAYIEIQTCPPDLPYADGETYNGKNICRKNCQESYNYKYTDNDEKKCLKSCPVYKYFVDTKDGLNTCEYDCPAGKKYIDQYKNSDYAYLCVESCGTNYYIDELSHPDLDFCVPSCKNLIPPAYISYNSPKKCTRSCESGELIDFASDINNPKCVSNCPSGSFLDKLTDTENWRCVTACQDLIPSAYINSAGDECVKSCSGQYIYYWYDETNKVYHPKCQANCDGMFIDEITDSGNPRCIESCKQLFPSAYIDSAGTNCVSSCTGDDDKIEWNSGKKEYQCKSECSESLYIDDLTDTNKKQCVSSCYNLRIPAYIQEKQCVADCDFFSEYKFIDEPDGKDPKCVKSCSTNPYIYDLRYCVKSCSKQQSDIFLSGTSCVSICPDDAPFVDQTSVSGEYKCVAECPKRDEKDRYVQLIQGHRYCVDSCKEQTPTAYIFDGELTQEGKKFNTKHCVTSCPSAKEYIDGLTDIDNPVCVDKCADDYFIDEITYTFKKLKDGSTTEYEDYTEKKVCTKSCRSLVPIAYVESATSKKCIRSCPKVAQFDNSTHGIANSDLKEFICKDKCDENYYMDEITLDNAQLCVPSCRNLFPEAYVYDNKCTRKNQDAAIFLQPGSKEQNFNELFFSETCDSESDYPYSDGLTVDGRHICVSSCKNLNPTAYIYETTHIYSYKDSEGNDQTKTVDIKKCVRDCASNSDKKYVNFIDIENPKCDASCQLNYVIDATSSTTGQYYCVQNCNDLFPYIYIEKKITPYEYDTCVDQCPDSAEYVDTSDANHLRCVDECPDSYYIDSLTTNASLCVKSCKNLEPSAYIDFTSKKCVNACSGDNKYLNYWNNTDSVQGNQYIPTCMDRCADDYYSYKQTTNISTTIVCVPTCKDLDPIAYIFVDSAEPEANKNTCVHTCPTEFKYVDSSDKEKQTCADKCPENYYIDSITDSNVKMCVPSCKNLEPMAYIYADTSNDDKLTCIRKCPADQYVDWSDEDHPKCTATKPTDYYLNTLTNTTNRSGSYVSSCKNLIPPAYINGDECVEKCPDSGNIYVDEISDTDNPKCAEDCGDNYIDVNSINDTKRCVASCKNLEPTAFILANSSNEDKKECVRKCPYDESGKQYFVDYSTDPDNPKCVEKCPDNHYIDSLTSDFRVCVPSCNDLVPPAIIYTISDDKEECMRVCPEGYYADFATDAKNPKCVKDCPTNSYIDNTTINNYTDNDSGKVLKRCVPSCKNLNPTAYIYIDNDLDNENKKTCISLCPFDEGSITNEYYVDASDIDNPRCTKSCPADYYIDNLSDDITNKVRMCVPSCKDLIPSAYFYENAALKTNNKKQCIRNCSALETQIYVNRVDAEKPECKDDCPDNYYIDNLSEQGMHICVPSCLTLSPGAYYFVDSNGKEVCTRSCKQIDHDYDDATAKKDYKVSSNITNPKCDSECKEGEFIDSLSEEPEEFCVKSCKNLEPSAYIYDKDDDSTPKCVRACNKDTTGAYIYLDALTDADHPKCTKTCGNYLIYTTAEGEQICVQSCAFYDQYVYVNPDNGDKKECVRLCPEGYYVDYNSTDSYKNHPTCVKKCENNYYIDSLSDPTQHFCVDSCKNLYPMAYIDASDSEFKKCTRQCPEHYPYIDMITDPDHPICVQNCSNKVNKYLYDTENSSLIYCVESCRLTIGKPYIDEITYPLKPDCVSKCRSETAPLLDAISDPGNPICILQCPTTAKYLDEASDETQPLCLDECKDTAPYDDEVTIKTTPKCLKQCLPGTYAKNYHCLKCSSPCKECWSSADYCTKCVDNYYLFGAECVEVCPDGYYKDPSDWKCKGCYETCETCSGADEDQCLTCKDNYIITEKWECITQEVFNGDTTNLEIKEPSSFDELDIQTEQIKNIGNLNNTDATEEEIQEYMVNTTQNSVDYLENYVESSTSLNSDKQQQITKNLQKISNVTVQLPVDSITTVLKTTIQKLDVSTSNQTIISNMFQTTSNLLKYMKSGSKKFAKYDSSQETSQQNIIEEIDKIGTIGLQIFAKKLSNSNRRVLETAQFQYYQEYNEFSLLLEGHSLSEDKWQSEVAAQGTGDFFYYEQNEQIKFKDMDKIAINYPKSLVEEIKSKIKEKDVDTVLVKITSHNFIREANNKYQEALLDTQSVFGSAVTFSFWYKSPTNSTIYPIDCNLTESYITLKIPLNYKLNGDEDLQCMTYDEDIEEWTDENAVTAEKTDTYVVCRTRQLNAITVIHEESVEFKKNYALYLSCFQLPFIAIFLFIINCFRKTESKENPEPSHCATSMSISPFFSPLTAFNGAHVVAKIMLFAFQLAVIDFVIAIFYNYNHILNEGEIKDIVQLVVYSLLINYAAKYIFGFILCKISIQREGAVLCVLYTLLMTLFYVGLSIASSYFVYNPEHDKFYNVGLKTTLIAYGFDFVVFDLLFIVVMLVSKLYEKAPVEFGGYLSKQSQRINTRAKQYLIENKKQEPQNPVIMHNDNDGANQIQIDVPNQIQMDQQPAPTEQQQFQQQEPKQLENVKYDDQINQDQQQKIMDKHLQTDENDLQPEEEPMASKRITAEVKVPLNQI